MKAIIFGIQGQDGFYLRELLLSKKIEVLGVSRTNKQFIIGNLNNLEFVANLIKTTKPDFVFHFAANSTTSHDALFENNETIGTGTFNLLESVYKFSKHTKVFLAGSAVQFENKGLPINEHTSFSANSPYAVSRIQSVYAGRYYRSLGLKVYVGYFFNHDSPLRSERHINQKIVLAVSRISKGSREKIEIGDINVEKEFNFAGDFMVAVWSLINQDRIFEAVIGSGKVYRIKDWIDICFDRINKCPEDYVRETSFFNSEYKRLVSDPTLIFSMGYQPKCGILELAEKMLKN
jgi:GDPmannose 4,6-dehydratase